MTVIESIQKGELEALRAALASDPAAVDQTDPQGVPALRLALYYRRTDAVDLLLAAGASLDPFTAAALGRSAEVASAFALQPSLLSTLSSDGWTPLHLAAFFGQEDTARLLLSLGAPVDVYSSNSTANLPLHAAAAGRHTSIVRLLLEAGSPPNAVTREGAFTALHSAAQNGDVATIRLLLDHGADPHPRNAAGDTPVMLARDQGHHEAAALFPQLH
jgi:ankyrin repeat protein